MLLRKILIVLMLTLIKPDVSEVQNDLVVNLDQNNFEQTILKYQFILVFFYAPWCPHCQIFFPKYSSISNELIELGAKVRLAQIDATSNQDVSKKYQVTAYPTLLYFQNGISMKIYDGNRASTKLISWLLSQSEPERFSDYIKNKKEDQKRIIIQNNILILNDNNFQTALQQYPNIFIQFYAPWCQYCIRLETQYLKLAKHFAEINPDIKIAKIDAIQYQQTSFKQYVSSFPTLILRKNNHVFVHSGQRTANKIIDWINKINLQVNYSIQSQQLIDDFIHDQKIGKVIYYGPSNTKQYQNFYIASLSVQKPKYVNIQNEKLIGSNKIPSIISQYPINGENWNIFDGNFTTNQIFKWLQSMFTQVIIHYEDIVINALQQPGYYGLIVLNNQKDTQKLFYLMRKYCPEDSFIFFCVNANIQNTRRLELIKQIQIQFTQNNQSLMFIIDSSDGRIFFYQDKLQNITQQNFLDFYEKFQRNELKQYIKPSRQLQKNQQSIQQQNIDQL